MRRPQEPSLLYPKKTKNPNPSPIGNRFGFFLFGGRGWIRTTEAESSRFTVCPHWPLGNTPRFIFQSRGLLVYITTRIVICQQFSEIFFLLLAFSPSLFPILLAYLLDYSLFSAVSGPKESIMCCKKCVIKRKSRLDFNESKRLFLELVTGVEPATH